MACANRKLSRATKIESPTVSKTKFLQRAEKLLFGILRNKLDALHGRIFPGALELHGPDRDVVKQTNAGRVLDSLRRPELAASEPLLEFALKRSGRRVAAGSVHVAGQHDRMRRRLD